MELYVRLDGMVLYVRLDALARNQSRGRKKFNKNGLKKYAILI